MKKPIVLITSAIGRIGKAAEALLAQVETVKEQACFYNKGRAVSVQGLRSNATQIRK